MDMTLSYKVHHQFTDEMLKNLHQNNIRNVVDFSSEDNQRLAMLTQLSIPDLIAIKSHIYEKYSVKLLNGLELLEELECIETNVLGIKQLDNLLPQGLPVGLSEIFGLANSCKTLLCKTISINHLIAKNTNLVLYIDTKGDFCAVKLQKMLEARSFSHMDMVSIMLRLKVLRVWTLSELLNFFLSVERNELSIDAQLVIVDSMPALMFQHLGEDNKLALVMLNKFVNSARHFCDQNRSRVIVVNIETRWLEQLEDIEDPVTEDGISKKPWLEKRNRCLGKYWQHVPCVAIKLESNENSEEKVVTVTIIKSNSSASGVSCDIVLTNKGF